PPPTPTPNIISDSDLAAAKTEWLQTVADVTGLTEAEYREFVRKGVLRTKVRKALEAEVSHTAEQANARHILVETEEEAKDVLARLEAGEDFAALAKELSKDPGSAENGGELGFVPRGRFVQPVEEAVFSLPVGQLSEPIQSQFGWHIIQVLAREERELSPADYSQVQQTAFSNWEAKARQNADIQDLWTADMAPPDSFSQPQ
ncbi:MAG: post-translocation molecular chaperone, partial [Chloroflexi bacterium]